MPLFNNLKQTTLHSRSLPLNQCIYHIICIFPKNFFQVATSGLGIFPRGNNSQMCNLPSGCRLFRRVSRSLVHLSRSAQPSLQPAVHEKEKSIEVSAWKIAHLGSCHLGTPKA